MHETDTLKDPVVQWLRAAQVPKMRIEDVHEYYQTVSPRVVFMKSLPAGARLIDFGAGDGTTAFLRTWPTFPRPDIRLFAIALDGAENFGAYEEYWLGNVEVARPAFGETEFDGILCCHCIEHLQRLAPTLEWMYSALARGGRLFLEWPHEVSKHVISRKELIKLGYDVSTTNFYDDGTHFDAWPMAEVVSHALRIGFEVEARGRIMPGYLGDMMRDAGLHAKDQTTVTFAIWAYTGWAQYLVLTKP